MLKKQSTLNHDPFLAKKDPWLALRGMQGGRGSLLGSDIIMEWKTGIHYVTEVLTRLHSCGSLHRRKYVMSVLKTLNEV